VYTSSNEITSARSIDFQANFRKEAMLGGWESGVSISAL
jgi:hypothetical protein